MLAVSVCRQRFSFSQMCMSMSRGNPAATATATLARRVGGWKMQNSPYVNSRPTSDGRSGRLLCKPLPRMEWGRQSGRQTDDCFRGPLPSLSLSSLTVFQKSVRAFGPFSDGTEVKFYFIYWWFNISPRNSMPLWSQNLWLEIIENALFTENRYTIHESAIFRPWKAWKAQKQGLECENRVLTSEINSRAWRLTQTVETLGRLWRNRFFRALSKSNHKHHVFAVYMAIYKIERGYSKND